MASAASTITVRCTDGFTHTVDGSAAAAASRRLEAIATGTSVPSAASRLLHTTDSRTTVTHQDAVTVPCELLGGVLAGYDSDRSNLRLCSDSFVHRWQCQSACGADDVYLKAQRLANARDPPVSREAAVMRWLHQTHPALAAETLPIPKVLAEVTEGGAGFLATAALSGISSHDLVTRDAPHDAIAATVRSNAAALRRLHDGVDIAGCPFQCGVASEIAAGRARLRAKVLPEDEW
jgi:aminoglycoside phosphotransferase